MFSLTYHSAYADTSNGPNDMPSGIAELIHPTSGTVQTLWEDVLPYIRGAGNSFYLPLFRCHGTRDVETGQFPDWYLRYLPRFYVNEYNGEILIEPSPCDVSRMTGWFTEVAHHQQYFRLELDILLWSVACACCQFSWFSLDIVYRVSSVSWTTYCFKL